MDERLRQNLEECIKMLDLRIQNDTFNTLNGRYKALDIRLRLSDVLKDMEI